MDGFIFYILLVVITALCCMLCSCLWKNYRNRAFAAWQRQQIQQQRFLAYQHSQQLNSSRPVVIGIFQGASDMPFVIQTNDPTESNPPAYNDVISHPEVYPSHVESTGVDDKQTKTEEMPPPYSEIRS